MLDIQFVRDNLDLVAEKSAQKGYPFDKDLLKEVDAKCRQLATKAEELRAERNALTESIKGRKPTDEELQKGRQIKEQLEKLEGEDSELVSLERQRKSLLKGIANMPLSGVPIGSSEEENVIAKLWGEKPVFDFSPKSHWEIAEARSLIDKERAAKVSGSRFAYIKGDLVKLEFAIIQFVMSTLTDEQLLEKLIQDNSLHLNPRAFIPILPPAMIKTDAYDAMDRLEPRDDRYRVGEDKDELWLQGSAEHTIGSMYWNEIFQSEDELPIRYIGFLTSFRREAGTYGKDTEGIIRMHQFDKLEMEVFSTPETGEDEHKLLVAIQEYLVQQLGLHYRLLQKCTFDIGKPNASGWDIEVWMSGQNNFRETHTADYMTDYQARRLSTKVKRKAGGTSFVHTNDATAFALGRIMVAIIENYQTKEGYIRVPEVLKPYLGGKELI